MAISDIVASRETGLRFQERAGRDFRRWLLLAWLSQVQEESFTGLKRRVLEGQDRGQQETRSTDSANIEAPGMDGYSGMGTSDA